MTKDDLILAFFPCIHFCDAKNLFFQGVHISQKNKKLHEILDYNMQESEMRETYYIYLLKLCSFVSKSEKRLIIENPWNTSRNTYLQLNFIKPSVIDSNRMLRGDFYTKPTAYWYINCEPTSGKSYQNDKERKIIMKSKGASRAGICSEERSMISPDYARNFICDFILGKEQKHTMRSLFNE